MHNVIGMKAGRRMVLQGLVTLILVWGSCRSNDAIQVLPEEKIRSIFIALVEANAGTRAQPVVPSKQAQADSIFKAFETSERDFRDALATYEREPVRWQRLLREVELELKRRDAAPKEQ
jgi:hypothetical protein